MKVLIWVIGGFIGAVITWILNNKKIKNIMILQENIKKKAEGYGTLAPAFIEGAKYALENQWISVDEDLPCLHEELIYGTEVSEGTETVEVFARNEHGDIWDDYMVYENNKWRWNDFEPAYWMFPPKLPKE